MDDMFAPPPPRPRMVVMMVLHTCLNDFLVNTSIVIMMVLHTCLNNFPINPRMRDLASYLR